MLTQEEVDEHEEKLRLMVRDLPDEKRRQFYALAKKKLKDPDTFAVLNYLFITGLHHFYLGKWFRGAVNFAGFVMALILPFMGKDLLGLGIFLAIVASEMYALFHSQIIVQDYNNKVMENTLQQLQDNYHHDV